MSGKVVVVTNGNFFSMLALRQVLEPDGFHVFVTTGLRRPKGNRLAEAWRLFRVWGLRYTAYKVATYALPAVSRRPLSVVAVCKERGIPCEVVRNVNDEGVAARIAALQPDLLVSYSCPYRIKAPLLAVPRVGAVNVHSSLLPAYAGVCTYIHVLANGEAQTGVTVHEMVEEFDAGRVLAQEPVAIEPGMSVARLFAIQSVAAGRLLKDVIGRRSVEGRPQDRSRRSYFGEPTKADVKRLRARGHRLLRLADLRLLTQGVVGEGDAEHQPHVPEVQRLAEDPADHHQHQQEP